MLAALFLASSLGAQSSPPQTSAATTCAQQLAAGTSASAMEICLGEDLARLGGPSWPRAADHYRRAVTLASDGGTKARALNALAELQDAKHLNDLQQMEQVLRELIALQPDVLAHLFRLSRVQENRGLIDAAEDTLLAARHQQPEAIDAYRTLAQFYARRTTALQQLAESQKPPDPARLPGERDENGVYRVGGAVTPPQRLDRAVYPPEAQAAGIEGAVVVDLLIGETGDVTDARVVRSVPLLDDEALRTARSWHFKPTIVNGQAVAVRMNVTVNFTVR